MSKVIVQNLNSLSWFCALLRGINRHYKQFGEPLQGVLIHGVDSSKIDNSKEQNRSSISNWSESFSNNIDFSLSDLRLLHSDVNFIRSLFRFIKNDNQLIIKQDIGNVVELGKSGQDLVLQFKHSLCSLSVLSNDLFFLSLEVWHFLSNKLVKHLLFKTEWSNSEVEDRYLDRGFWRVMWVWNGGGHEESEVFVILYLLLSDSQVTTLVYLLKQDWLKCWI